MKANLTMRSSGRRRLTPALGRMKRFARTFALWVIALAAPPATLRLYLHLYYTGALSRSLPLLARTCALLAFPGSVAIGVWLLYISLAKWPSYRVPTCIIYAALMLCSLLILFRVVACFSYGDCM